MFDNADYDAFQELFADRGVGRRITTQDQFEKFVELRKAALAGDTATVDSLKSELGLGHRMMDGSGRKWGMNDGTHEGRGQGRWNK
ncbi:MAG: hypothetical protein GXP45_02120 [bacterium]|nr:hypothetical protein [bacterium]